MSPPPSSLRDSTDFTIMVIVSSLIAAVWGLVCARRLPVYVGVTCAAFCMSCNVALFYLDMARGAVWESDASLVKEVIWTTLNGFGILVYVANDLMLPEREPGYPGRELNLMLPNDSTTSANSTAVNNVNDARAFVWDPAFARRTLSTPYAVGIAVGGIFLIAMGALSFYSLAISRQHTLEADDNRCKHIQANVKDGNFVKYCMSGHAESLSAMLLIVLSTTSFDKCMFGELDAATRLFAKFPPGNASGHAHGETWLDSFHNLDAVLLLATSTGSIECSASGQASNMLSFFVASVLLFSGLVLGRKVATVEAILDNKAHPLILGGAIGIAISALCAVVVLFFDTLGVGAGSDAARHITSFSSGT